MATCPKEGNIAWGPVTNSNTKQTWVYTAKYDATCFATVGVYAHDSAFSAMTGANGVDFTVPVVCNSAFTTDLSLKIAYTFSAQCLSFKQKTVANCLVSQQQKQ